MFVNFYSIYVALAFVFVIHFGIVKLLLVIYYVVLLIMFLNSVLLNNNLKTEWNSDITTIKLEIIKKCYIKHWY